MKQSIGTPAVKEKYYPRTNISLAVINSLQNESNIYLSGPRRIGKTSIMLHLEDSKIEEFHFIYNITESVDDENTFYKVLFESLLKSNEVNGFIKITESLKKAGLKTLEFIDEISVIKLKESKEADYYSQFCSLLKKVELTDRKIVIMVDEFPQTIQNIQEKHGDGEAKKFIQRNRELRHLPELINKVKFIYTGSIALYPMVQKLCPLTEINDLVNVPVKPFSNDEASDCMASLLGEKKLTISKITMDYLIKKIKWLIPFHCQLMVHEVSLYATTGSTEITNKFIDEGFENIIDSRNKPQFQPYFSRLKNAFKNEEYTFVIDLLGACAMNDYIDKLSILDLAIRHKIQDSKFILEKLIDDGYIYKEDKNYRFNSPLLQAWCKKYVYDEADI